MRVFKDVILSNLLEPKYKKSDLDILSYTDLRDLAEEIINFSLGSEAYDFSINERLFNYENSVFNISDEVNELINNRINYKAILDILPEYLPFNLQFLKALKFDDYFERRHFDGFCFPIEKLVLCEGITEEILLPKFAKICGVDLGKKGIYIISAGGKNQVVKYFYNFSQVLKIPIFVLLDNDATNNLNEIRPKLRKNDTIHLLRSGEFEDLLPDSLIIKALKQATENISFLNYEELSNCNSKVEFLKDFFRHRGLHEFKKAEFAKFVKDNIITLEDASLEIREIISEIAK